MRCRVPPKDRFEYLAGKEDGLAVDQESGIIYAIKHFRGMPALYKSLQTKDRKEAKRRLPQKIKEHLERYSDGKREAGRAPTVAEVIEEIQRTESTTLRKKTQRQRTFYFERIRDEMDLGHMPMDKLTLKLWADRLERLQRKHKAEAQKSGKRLRKTYWGFSKNANILNRYAYEQKYVSHLVTFPNPDGLREPGTVFTIEEIRQLWNVMGENTRDQFVLSYECCMRLREMLHLTWDRVDLETGEITLRQQDVKTGSKTGKGRQFIMTDHALERLKKRRALIESVYLGAGRPVPRYVFPSPTGNGPVDDNKIAWNRAKRDVLEGNKRRGIKANPSFQHWGTWHDLRHTAISRMLVEQKMNITLVSEYVGTSVSTLQKVYLHSKAEHTKGINAALKISSEDE
jgi:integrase